MNVYLSFDIEVWCDGWSDLDGRFPGNFQRYYYGRSEAGDYALPKTLEILNRHGLVGVFFVEPLFSARFGARYLAEVVDLIRGAGQDVQLHLHPEWTDEIRPPVIADISRKRQHLTYYTEDEQAQLITFARGLLEAATGTPVNVFRSGSFAVNRDTYRALRRCGLHLDSSGNPVYDLSGGTLPLAAGYRSLQQIDGVTVFPVTVFRDGFGRLRSAQLNGCSFEELSAALLDAERSGSGHFVIVSHNFEMLKPGRSEPDWTVVRRFEKLCAFLGAHPDRFTVGPYPDLAPGPEAVAEPRPRAPLLATARRHDEQQLLRRLG